MADRSPEKEPSDYFARRESSTAQTPRARREAFRPRLAALQTPGSPTSPRTPRTPLVGRSASSNFGSPGLTFRQDDEYFIFEFSNRFLRAGLAGEGEPRCQLTFSPKSHRRAGDYSTFLPGGHPQTFSTDDSYKSWGESHELWRMDLRGLDLALVGDKIERALRDAIRDHILVLDDAKKRKVMLVIPPVVPHPLLSMLCTKIFDLHLPPQSITLLSAPTLSTVAAGLRSALVIELGWSATTISAVYELREVKHMTSTRAMKFLSWKFNEMLTTEIQRQFPDGLSSAKLSFEDVEEVMHRMAWSPCDSGNEAGREVTLDLPSLKPPRKITLPFEQFSKPVESAFFTPGPGDTHADDDELILPFLMFVTLLALPIDARETCLQRIVFTGQGAAIPGLRSRLLADLSAIILDRGWDGVHNYGSAKKLPRKRTALRSSGPIAKEAMIEQPSEYINKDMDTDSNVPAHLQPPLPDPVLNKVRSRVWSRAIGLVPTGSDLASEGAEGWATKPLQPTSVSADRGIGSPSQLQCIASLGAWAGASLLAGLRVPGLVEIERERFVQHGLHARGASIEEKRKSVPQQAQRQSYLGGVGGAGKVGENAGWTLGIWA